MRALSLRTRLVAVAVALVAFAVIALCVGTYVALRGFLYNRLDEEVASDAHAPAPVCASGPSQTNPVLAVLDPRTGQAVNPCVLGYPTAGLDIADEDGPVVLANAGAVVTIHATTGQEYRAMAVLAAPRRDHEDDYLSGAPFLVVTARPVSEVTGTLGKLLALELIGGAIALAGTAALGTLGVRVGLRPLDRVTRTARAVAAELSPDGTGLDRRVPKSEPTTEVGQLAEAVNTMLDTVEREYSARWESEQRMRRFLADASHELRTPLTSLRGYAELIRLRGGDGVGSEAWDSLRRIESEGTRMSRLVDDLLTLARSDRGVPVERVPVDVAEVIEDAAADLRAAHPDREVDVAASGRLVVLGDRDQLVQVVSNVLTNAVAHATNGGPVTVTADRHDGEVVVAIADTGPGMRPDQVGHAFERFWRADAARTRARGGSGLGLSIVHALVTDHGGTVTLESDERTGTTVTLRLPVAAAPSPTPALPAGTSASPAPAEPPVPGAVR